MINDTQMDNFSYTMTNLLSLMGKKNLKQQFYATKQKM